MLLSNTPPASTVLVESKADMTSPSAENLAERRQLLRAKRKAKFYKMAWRSFFTTAIAVGTVKLATSPIWLIRSSQQIEVSDNQLIPAENVRALLPITYPEALVNLQPKELAASIAANPAIDAAVVRRKLIPPMLQVELTERIPVAVALPSAQASTQNNSQAGAQASQSSSQSSPDRPVPFKESGLIDAQGYWMPRNSFVEVGADISLPLQVIGMRTENTLSWQTIYREVSRSPVEITAIDWSDSDNIVLHSELGQVQVGPYSPQFSKQISALDQLRNISDQTPLEQIAFINLQNPQTPIIETIESRTTSDNSSNSP